MGEKSCPRGVKLTKKCPRGVKLDKTVWGGSHVRGGGNMSEGCKKILFCV